MIYDKQKGSPLEQNLQKYYESSFDLFSSDGWAYLIEDFQKIKDSVDTLSSVTNVEELYFRKGQLDILTLILKRKEMFTEVYEGLKDETIL